MNTPDKPRSVFDWRADGTTTVIPDDFDERPARVAKPKTPKAPASFATPAAALPATVNGVYPTFRCAFRKHDLILKKGDRQIHLNAAETAQFIHFLENQA